MVQIPIKPCVLVWLIALLVGCGSEEQGHERLRQVAPALGAPIDQDALLRFMPEQLAEGAGDWAAYAKCLEVVTEHEDEFESVIDHFLVVWDPGAAVLEFQMIDSPWFAQALTHLKDGVSGNGPLSSADFLSVHAQLRGIFTLEALIWNQVCVFAERGDGQAAARVLHDLLQFAADLTLQGDLDLRTIGMSMLSMSSIDPLLESGWWAEHGAVLSPVVLAAGREVEQVFQESHDAANRIAETLVLAQMAAALDATTSNPSELQRDLFEREVALVFAKWREIEATGGSEPWIQAEALLGKGAFADTHPMAQFLAPRVQGLAETQRWTLARILAQRCVDAALHGDLQDLPTAHGMVATAERGPGGFEVTVNDSRTEDMILLLDVVQR